MIDCFSWAKILSKVHDNFPCLSQSYYANVQRNTQNPVMLRRLQQLSWFNLSSSSKNISWCDSFAWRKDILLFFLDSGFQLRVTLTKFSRNEERNKKEWVCEFRLLIIPKMPVQVTVAKACYLVTMGSEEGKDLSYGMEILIQLLVHREKIHNH